MSLASCTVVENLNPGSSDAERLKKWIGVGTLLAGGRCTSDEEVIQHKRGIAEIRLLVGVGVAATEKGRARTVPGTGAMSLRRCGFKKV